MTRVEVSAFHSQKQKQDVQRAAQAILGGGQFQSDTAYQVLSQVTKHGLDEFDALEAHLAARDSFSSRGARFRARLKLEYSKVCEIRQSVPPKLLSELEDQVLARAGPTFIQGRSKNAETCVAFLTTFNNFHLSNIALVLPLLERGFSVLLLRTDRKSLFFNGISGYGDDWESSVKVLRSFLDDRPGPFRITGFSSSGYASFMAALSLAPAKYIGFSVCGDLDASSPTPNPPYFDRWVRDKTPVSLHRNLIAEARDTKVPIKIFAGELNGVERQQANAFQAIPTARVNILPNVGHMTVGAMFLKDRFFSELTS